MGADQIGTALALIYRGSKAARGLVSPGMREPDINRTVWQSMRRRTPALGAPRRPADINRTVWQSMRQINDDLELANV